MEIIFLVAGTLSFIFVPMAVAYVIGKRRVLAIKNFPEDDEVTQV